MVEVKQVVEDGDEVFIVVNDQHTNVFHANINALGGDFGCTAGRRPDACCPWLALGRRRKGRSGGGPLCMFPVSRPNRERMTGATDYRPPDGRLQWGRLGVTRVKLA